MVEKQHRWSLSWDSTGMLSGAFQAFHFNRFIAPRTLFSFFLSSDRCKRSWFRAHNCHFGVRVLFQVVLEFSSQLTTFHGHSWTDSLHFFTWRVLESLLTFVSSITDAWTSQEASLSGQKPKPESFPFFWAPTRALTCPSGWWHCSFFTQEPFTTSTENMVLWQEICRLIQPRRIIKNILQTLKHSPSREMTP